MGWNEGKHQEWQTNKPFITSCNDQQTSSHFHTAGPHLLLQPTRQDLPQLLVPVWHRHGLVTNQTLQHQSRHFHSTRIYSMPTTTVYTYLWKPAHNTTVCHSIYLPVCLSPCISIHPSVLLYVCLSSVCLSMHPWSVYLYVHSSVHLSVCD